MEEPTLSEKPTPFSVLANAKEGDTIVVAVLDDKGMVCWTVLPTSGRLLQVAQSLLDHAADLALDDGDEILAECMREALDILPDPFSEDATS